MGCLTPVVFYKETDGLRERVQVPCGKCPACLARRRQQWTYRLIMENKVSESSFFVTLTYDNSHLPQYGVSKSDVQKFFKRFRKVSPKVRYFLVSHYGDKFGRAHYHCLFFFKEKVKLTNMVHMVDRSWKLGNIQVGDVTPASIAYCSKYALKEHKDATEYLDPLSGEIYLRAPLFCLMSRRPGIGSEVLGNSQFVKNHIFNENVQFVDYVAGNKYLIPRYYRDKVYTLDLLNSYHNFILEKYGKEKPNPKREHKGNNFLTQFRELKRRANSR